jgi:hypothetical protein
MRRPATAPPGAKAAIRAVSYPFCTVVLRASGPPRVRSAKIGALRGRRHRRITDAVTIFPVFGLTGTPARGSRLHPGTPADADTFFLPMRCTPSGFFRIFVFKHKRGAPLPPAPRLRLYPMNLMRAMPPKGLVHRPLRRRYCGHTSGVKRESHEHTHQPQAVRAPW